MKWKRSGWMLLLALALTGCNRQDTEALVRIGKKLQNRTEVVTGDVKSNAAASWQTVGETGVEGRVAARLRWDKELEGTNLQVLPSGSGVEISGKVRNLEQRQRALMLAQSTAGVEGVKDSLIETDR